MCQLWQSALILLILLQRKIVKDTHRNNNRNLLKKESLKVNLNRNQNLCHGLISSIMFQGKLNPLKREIKKINEKFIIIIKNSINMNSKKVITRSHAISMMKQGEKN